MTYAAVIVLTVGAAIYYYNWSSKSRGRIGTEDKGDLVAVGDLWVAAYPGATITSRSTSKQGGITQTTLHVRSSDSAALLFAFYQRKLRGGSFLPSAPQRNGDGGVLQATVRGGQRRVQVTVAAAPEGCVADITSFEKEP